MRRALERQPRAPRVILRLDVPFAGVAAWLAAVDPAEARLAWLGDGERARAARLSDPDAARHYVAERCTIRRIVAAHLGGGPERVRLEGAGGPPCLPGLVGVHISIARSRRHVAVALADRRVGVDIEISGAASFAADAGQGLFHPSDPPIACREDFYRLWTRKEAAFKAARMRATFDPAAPIADRTPDGRAIESASLAVPAEATFGALAVTEATSGRP